MLKYVLANLLDSQIDQIISENKGNNDEIIKALHQAYLSTSDGRALYSGPFGGVVATPTELIGDFKALFKDDELITSAEQIRKKADPSAAATLKTTKAPVDDDPRIKISENAVYLDLKEPFTTLDGSKTAIKAIGGDASKITSGSQSFVGDKGVRVLFTASKEDADALRAVIDKSKHSSFLSIINDSSIFRPKSSLRA